jgi:hypothetical protein
VDSCKCAHEPSCFIKCGEFFDYLRICQLLKKDSALWSLFAGWGVRDKLHSAGNSLWCLLNRMLGGVCCQCGWFGENVTCLASTGN